MGYACKRSTSEDIGDTMETHRQAIDTLVENAFSIRPVKFFRGTVTVGGQPGDAEIIVFTDKMSPFSKLLSLTVRT